MHSFSKTALSWVCFFVPFCCLSQQKVQQWGRFEKEFTYHSSGNGFEEVELSATFVNGRRSVTVAGFYEGDDIFKVRFMPSKKRKMELHCP